MLIFSPQYTKLPGRSESTNHNVYLIGRMDYDTLTFTPEGPYRHLDYGFDFYAAQAAANVADADRAILIAWIGLPDNHYPTEEEDREGSLSLPRELRVKGGRLVQTPLEALSALRGAERPADGDHPEACELDIDVTGDDFRLSLFAREGGEGGLKLSYDAATRTCTVDKTGLDRRFNQAVGEALRMPLETPLRRLRVFVDRSSVELFANDGEATFTVHVYPTERERGLRVVGGQARLWPLSAAVKNPFVF